MKRMNIRGFTIIELLISTVIFSLILLVLTAAIVQIGRLYYKGVITSRTQETVRRISQDINQSIQFSNTPVLNSSSGNIRSVCIGIKRFTYRLDTLPSDTQRALLLDENPTPGSCSPAVTAMTGNLPAGGTELLGQNMRLVELSVEEPGNTANISIRIAYGEEPIEELLTSDQRSCRQGVSAGGQFCAVADLTTVVSRRL